MALSGTHAVVIIAVWTFIRKLTFKQQHRFMYQSDCLARSVCQIWQTSCSVKLWFRSVDQCGKDIIVDIVRGSSCQVFPLELL